MIKYAHTSYPLKENILTVPLLFITPRPFHWLMKVLTIGNIAVVYKVNIKSARHQNQLNILLDFVQHISNCNKLSMTWKWKAPLNEWTVNLFKKTVVVSNYSFWDGYLKNCNLTSWIDHRSSQTGPSIPVVGLIAKTLPSFGDEPPTR